MGFIIFFFSTGDGDGDFLASRESGETERSSADEAEAAELENIMDDMTRCLHTLITISRPTSTLSLLNLCLQLLFLLPPLTSKKMTMNKMKYEILALRLFINR